jgi:quercetin dioxygenase-like cupin family protein
MTRSGTDSAQPAPVVNLELLAEELARQAAGDHAGRAARTLPHPVDGLRQTLIAISDGAGLQEHNSPGPASLLVLRGAARLVAGDETVRLTVGDHTPIPPRRHALTAEGDAVILLSVAVGTPASGASPSG